MPAAELTMGETEEPATAAMKEDLDLISSATDEDLWAALTR